MTQSDSYRVKKTKNDEFHTHIEDVGSEVINCDLKDKAVYCNCDDKNSAFTWFFTTFFSLLGLKRLSCKTFNVVYKFTIVPFNNWDTNLKK